MNVKHYYLTEKKELLLKDNRHILTGGIIAVLLAYLMVIQPSFPSKESFTWGYLLSMYGMAFYIGSSFVAGWKLLHNFTSKTFLFLPIIGWIIYLYLKIALSLIIGAYFYGIYRFCNNLFKIWKVNKELTTL